MIASPDSEHFSIFYSVNDRASDFNHFIWCIDVTPERTLTQNAAVPYLSEIYYPVIIVCTRGIQVFQRALVIVPGDKHGCFRVFLKNNTH